MLKVDDVLAGLAVSAATEPVAAKAMAALPLLRDCDMHFTPMLHSGDQGTLRKLGLRITMEPSTPARTCSSDFYNRRTARPRNRLVPGARFYYKSAGPDFRTRAFRGNWKGCLSGCREHPGNAFDCIDSPFQGA